jgi:drug/metabolite transporter (DMT)-like permease
MVLVALIAKQFIGEVSWVDNLAQTGALLIGVGVVVELISRKSGEAAYRTAVGLALGSVLLLAWVNAAVGIIGSEDNDANLMYGGVLAVGAIGAIIALVGGLGSPHSGPLEIVSANGFFVALFVGSAVLFWKAARGRPELDAA